MRPEFIESVLYLYQATKDPHLLMIGADVVNSIYHSSRTDCGYATIKSVSDHTIEDRMESFFLAETLKYLYLLFDEDNFIHNQGDHGILIKRQSSKTNREEECIVETGGYVFNTEAHPLDVAALSCCSKDGFQDDIDLFKEDLDLTRILPFKKLSDSSFFDEIFEGEVQSDALDEDDLSDNNSTKSPLEGFCHLDTCKNFSSTIEQTEPASASQPLIFNLSSSTNTEKLLETVQSMEDAEITDSSSSSSASTTTASIEYYDNEFSTNSEDLDRHNINSNHEDCDNDFESSDTPTFDQLDHSPKYDLLSCPSQKFLSLLSLYGQMFY